MQHMLTDAEQWKKDLNKGPEFRLPYQLPSPAEIPVYTVTKPTEKGPCPLDPYLVRPVSSDKADYPRLKSVSEHGFNAPLPNNRSEAQAALKKAQETRQCLESNLDVVITSRKGADVYALLDALYKDGNELELTRIQRMVDDHILAAQTQLKRELQSGTKTAVDVGVTLSTKRGATALGQPGAGRRCTPGASKAGRGRGVTQTSRTARAAPPPGKENKPKGQKKYRLADFHSTEEFLTHVYGKAAYQSQRSTVKDPYLHYVNTARPKSPRPTAALHSTGVEVKSAKTQTGVGVAVPLVKGQYYFRSDHAPSNTTDSGPMDGQLVAMAVPLGSPRTHAGVTTSTAISPSASLTTSPRAQPAVSAPTNVAIVTIKEEEEPKEKRKPLVKQVLAQVNLTGSTTGEKEKSGQTSARIEINPNTYFDVAHHDTSAEQEESEEEDQSDVEITGTGIALPGYQAPPPATYYGPAFPPPAPVNQNVSQSQYLTEETWQRNKREAEALEWVEQELMARFITDMYSQCRPAGLPDREAGPADHDSDTSLVSDTGSAIVMNAVGSDGVQLFVDAGQPVDSDLVNQLIKEVLQEKIANMLGEFPEREERGVTEGSFSPRHPADERAGAPVSSPDIKQPPKPVPRASRNVISTPEPTPTASPVPSPPRHTSPPYTPAQSPQPDSPSPQPEVCAPLPVQTADVRGVDVRGVDVQTTESEPDVTSASLDIVEEMSRIAGTVVFPEEEGPVVQLDGSVHTPPRSPEPTPSTGTLKERVPTPPPDSSARPVTEEVTREMPGTDLIPSSGQAEAEPLDREEPAHESSKPHLLDATTSMTAGAGVCDQAVQPCPPAPGEGTEDTPGAQSVALSQSDSSSLPSSLTETINESLSEGQWLVSRSEGQLPAITLDEVARLGMEPRHARPGDFSIASTLRDTEDLETDMSQSEGEFCHRAMEEVNPMAALLAKLQEGVGFYQYDLPGTQVQALLNQTGQSTGEISLGQHLSGLYPPDRGGQQPRSEQLDRGHAERGARVTYPVVTVVESREAVAEKDSREGERMGEERGRPPTRETGPPTQEAGPPTREAGPLTRETGTPTRETRPPTREVVPGPSILRRSQESVTDIDVSMRLSDLQTSTPNRDRAQRMVTVSSGGRTSPAGRGRGKGRSTPGGPSLGGQRPVVAHKGSSSSLRASQEDMPADTRQGTGAFTPDQINTDALLQSGGYLSQTFSQSDGRASSEFNQSGGLLHSLNRSEGAAFIQSDDLAHVVARSADFVQSVDFSHVLTRSADFIQSTHSMDTASGSLSEAELRHLAQFGTGSSSGLRHVSVRIPSQGADDSDSDRGSV